MGWAPAYISQSYLVNLKQNLLIYIPTNAQVLEPSSGTIKIYIGNQLGFTKDCKTFVDKLMETPNYNK